MLVKHLFNFAAIIDKIYENNTFIDRLQTMT